MSETTYTLLYSCLSCSRLFSIATPDIYQHDTFIYRNCDIILVDTPGFDNVTKPDMSVLEQFVQFLQAKSSEGIQLSGIIYLHRITDVRMGGSATKNIQLLREICGNQFLSRVTLVTTMWDSVNQNIGANRERELQKSYWKEILDYGAMYHRQDGTRDAALRIVDGYFNSSLPPTNMKSNIEHQVMERGTPLPETDAGRFTLESIRQKIHQYKMKLQEKRQEQRENVYDEALEEEAAQIEEAIKKGEEELGSYRRMLADHRGSDGRKQRIEDSKEQSRQTDFFPYRSGPHSQQQQQPPNLLSPGGSYPNLDFGDSGSGPPREWYPQASTQNQPYYPNRPQSSHTDERRRRDQRSKSNRSSSYNQMGSLGLGDGDENIY
jgi:flagellar biosynthesis GTPase FlhF